MKFNQIGIKLFCSLVQIGVIIQNCSERNEAENKTSTKSTHINAAFKNICN